MKTQRNSYVFISIREKADLSGRLIKPHSALQFPLYQLPGFLNDEHECYFKKRTHEGSCCPMILQAP